MRSRSLIALLAIAVVATVTVGGCATKQNSAGGGGETKQGPTVRVASLLDSEGVVLGSMVIQMLEANGIPTEDKTKFGTPDVVRKAILAGDVDATIDYTGSGQYYVGPEGDPLWNDPEKGYQTIKEKDLANGLVWLTPAPANNSEYFGVKKEFAEANGLKSMEDFARYVNGSGAVKLIGDQSWMDNPAGLKAYEAAYGFTLRDDQKIGLSNGVTAQFIQALVNGTDGVNVAEVYATDGGLAEQGIVVLADTKNVPPVYRPTPVFRKEIIEAYPEIEGILKPVFESLTTETLQELNRQVAFGGKSGKDVAREYLVSKGFLKQ
ncbi:ABC transporter substrate-binding protein [Coriobacteriia bacterium Es71-Z0120]|uniref:glycine betaine ABC transporter substrate-binding protein n=1 Tax=Parvivirga hydrogeniphila TaxID=2939460 RepID=UPI002260A534|nr:glycine betaine ABC transporter substrate-binding protein [Parvivirga hydrogeniphila]MCL4079421.1 ABC transporter substrate-binding protein [Parvivirga hydrogeniphila]